MEDRLATTEAAQLIHDVRRKIAPGGSVIVAVSGIDGSGKGYVTDRILAEVCRLGLKADSSKIDGWLNLPNRRFNLANPAQHFYDHAIRFDEMFERLLRPLRANGSCRVEMDFTDETASEHRKLMYEFQDLDVLILEGIFLLKRAHLREYDLSFWVECTFEAALERAIERAQEGLPPEQTVEAYQTIYFPAQHIHFERDDPRASADAIICNDPNMGTASIPLLHVPKFRC